MQLTTQTRLTVSDAQRVVLDAFVCNQAPLKHKLYAVVAAQGGKALDHKTAFCATHGVSSRRFTAVATEVQGSIDGVRELLKEQVKDTQQGIKALTRWLATWKARHTQHVKGKGVLDAKALRRGLDTATRKHNKLNKLKAALVRYKARLAANVPGIAFGSRKLFAQQNHLAANGYATHAEWLRDWQAARAHTVSSVGSKDEAGGNQRITLGVKLVKEPEKVPAPKVKRSKAEALGPEVPSPEPKVKKPRSIPQVEPGNVAGFTLRIRIPDELIEPGSDKYLLIEHLDFEFDRAALIAALNAGQALSHKLHRDERGHWRLLTSFLRTAAPVQTRQACWGTLGVDFNADHLGVAQTDLHGNIIKAWRIELVLADKSTGQRKALMSDALQEVTRYALEHKLPVVIEDLDFRAKKKQLASMSPAKARMLSGLAYAQYTQLLATKCFRQGVALLIVNPAYTSTTGRLKYAVPYGRSVHLAAAGVIARKGQGYVDKLPRASSVRMEVAGGVKNLPAPARKPRSSERLTWAVWHKALTVFSRDEWVAAKQARDALAGSKGGKSECDAQPSDGTVPSPCPHCGTSLQPHEQVCSGCI